VVPAGASAFPRFTCGQASNRMSRALTKELKHSEWLMFRNHLRVCSGCHDKFLVMELAVTLSAGIIVVGT
jgi:hypothetical protein